MSQDYRRAIAEFIAREARPVDKYGHQPRLYELARRIAESEPCDDDVLYAAAWLHDLGVFEGHRPAAREDLERWDMLAYGMAQAPVFLRQTGFPEAKITAVVEAIRTHQPGANPQTPEAVVLRDADILEQLGAVGILRMVSKVGRDTRYPRFTDAVAVLRRSLAELPSKLRTQKARELAQPKIRALEAFLQAVDNEAGELLL